MKRLSAVACVALGIAGCSDLKLPSAVPDPARPAPSAAVRRGWVFGIDGAPIQVAYTVVRGQSIHEGDINLGAEGSVPETREELLRRNPGVRAGSAVTAMSLRWPGGQVPYVIAAGFTTSQQNNIQAAMNHIRARTGGVQFGPRTSESSYIVITPDPYSCDSYVGRRSGGQTIHLTSGCADQPGIVAHELLHALGMWHEQSRCDRDLYVTVHYENIDPSYSYNFDKKCGSGNSDVGVYALGSIMHYDMYAFSTNYQPTITANSGENYLMGQRQALHWSDGYTINVLYDPYPPSGWSTYPGGVPTISWDSSGASSHAVYLVIVWEDYDYYQGTSSSYEVSSEYVGETTELSLQDPNRSYTGNQTCEIYSSPWQATYHSYWYETRTTYPYGINNPPPVRRPAYVAPAPPC